MHSGKRILLGIGVLLLIVGMALLSFGVYSLVDSGDSTKTENVIDLVWDIEQLQDAGVLARQLRMRARS